MITRSTLTILVIVLGHIASFGRCEEPAERTVVHLIDPRIVTLTNNTLKTHYGDDKTDIIASRTLTKSEAKELWQLLDEELEDNTNVPFCGHSPAYGVQLFRGQKLVSSTTICGLCMTWARKGEFKRLKGKKSLDVLQKLIALPDVFVGKSLLDLSDMKQKPVVPFHQLDVATLPSSRKPLSITKGMAMEDALAAMQARGLKPQRMAYSGSHAAFDLPDGRTVVLLGDKSVDAIEIIPDAKKPKSERQSETVAKFDLK